MVKTGSHMVKMMVYIRIYQKIYKYIYIYICIYIYISATVLCTTACVRVSRLVFIYLVFENCHLGVRTGAPGHAHAHGLTPPTGVPHRPLGGQTGVPHRPLASQTGVPHRPLVPGPGSQVPGPHAVV